MITVWERYNHKKKKWEHNHISDGHDENPIPTGISKNQKQSWKGSTWRKFFGTLENCKVVLDD